MAAIAHPRPNRSRPQGPRPQLRVIDGGRSAARPSTATYRRRRCLAVAALVVVVLAACAAMARAGVGPLAAPAVATPAPIAVAGPGTYVVQPGDTWWSIARRLHPDGDVRPIVDELAARNGGPSLQVGQRVSIDG
ncbi:MAG: hypothetical protein JWO37_3124 [Acidimicrobiales bacterium]|jgi:nucleoid-associated protein YgaU|nr:hypothetical protein [Acidimicrobiales bacterium]